MATNSLSYGYKLTFVYCNLIQTPAMKYALLLLPFLIWSCDTSIPKEEATAIPETEKTTQSVEGTKELKEEAIEEVEEEYIEEDPTVLELEGAYATSVLSPYEQYNVNTLFDGDATTFWSTVLGAGPDEGVMLYLMKPRFVSKVTLDYKVNNEFSEVSQVIVYADGKRIYDQKVAGEFVIRELVKSLYVRIVSAKDSESSFLNKGMTWQTIFPKNKAMGMNEMKIYGNDDSEYKVKLPLEVNAKLTASSTLTESSTAYSIHNLFDSKKEYAWVEFATGDGIGQYFTMQFEEPIKIRGIRIRNGFQRSQKHFKSNSRLKAFEWNGEVYEVKDEMGSQDIFFKNEKTITDYKFIIKESFSGTSYQDLAISEILLLTDKGVMKVKNSVFESNRISLLKKVKNTLLDSLIDRQVNNTEEGMDGGYVSIVLRSDQTFVLYKSDSWMENYKNKEGEYTGQNFSVSDETIGEGSWEIQSLTEDSSKVKIFGKWYKSRKEQNEYTGDSEEEFVQIFKDVLTITPLSIKGQKFVDEIFYSNK
jgi:hypothetical protein